MLKVRVIPCLDVKDGRVVKGVQFLQLRDAGDPVAALAEWLRLLVGLSTRDGITATLLGGQSQWPQGFADEVHAALSATGGPLLDRARPALRPDLTLDELHALVHGIATASTAASDPGQRADRLLALVLDGLRARPDGEGMMDR